MSNPKLSVIIPCYNEEKRFQNGFDHYFSYLKAQKYLWELIFVNDGSTDNTLKLIRQNANDNKNIKIVSYSKNSGKGYAIVKGVETAKGRYILFSDLDHSVPITTVSSFFKQFKKGYDVVIGSRRVEGAKLLVRQPKTRELLGRGFTLLVRILIDPTIKDSTCGFKAFEQKIAKQLFAKITIYDWAFDAEVLYLAKIYHFKVAQVPVTWSDVRGSKVSLKKDILRSLFGLFKIRINDLTGKYST